MPNEYKEVELVYTVYRAAKIPKDAVVKFSHYGILYYTHQGKTYKTRTMEPGCDYKSHEKVCVNELDTDEEPDEEPDEVDENEARQDSDSDEDTDEDYECEECGVQVIAADIPENECRSIAYGSLSMAFCKPCYERSWAEHPENPANASKDESDDDEN